MKVGIIGFARSGKTTIFNVLTGAHATVGTFGSREANIAVLKVPDERVDRLAEVFRPEKKTYVEIQFLDVGPSESSGERKALDIAALNVLKTVDALAHVVRAFKNDQVAHPAGAINPVRDCKVLEEELQLDDLLIIEKRLERLEKENRKEREYALLLQCRKHVESGLPLRKLALSPQDIRELSGFGFLSQKPLLLVGNYGEESLRESDPSGLESYAQEQGMTLVALSGEMEMEVAQLPEDERQTFRNGFGLGESSCTRFLRAAYDLLGLVSFLTTIGPEVRAWTVPKGTKAADAAGAIHSDMQRGFIRAEVVGYDAFASAGSVAKAKELGMVRSEGKDYIVQDGDIILFRFHV